mgnify:CR=1 FL=1
MRVKRPVTVKMIVTHETKKELLRQCEQSIRQLELELEQLSFERRKLLHRAEKQGRDVIQQAEARLQEEVSERREKQDQLKLQYEQIKQLPEGSEIIHGQVESEVTVELGDNWEELMKNQEIVLKDGIVHEIRGGKDS